ncbi:MAG: CHAP domain-containing protein [Nitrospiria bacterium]
MAKRSFWALFLLIAVSIVGLASTGESVEVVPCSTTLVSYKGVSARSNENNPYESCGGRSLYGLKYQCVEYVRRFYHLVQGVETRNGFWEGHANTYFKTAEGKGLNAFENGGPVPPLPDDIITFQGGPHGHVAIITAVTDDHIEFIEQNFSPTGTDRLAYNSTTHRVADRRVPGGRLILQGWLRPSSD